METERLRVWVKRKLGEAVDAGEPISEIVTLTPALAFVLLETNIDNRPVSQLNIERIARDIASNRWQLNGQSLVIASDGSLNDGQHRCWGVIEANKAVRTAIVFGTKRDTRFTLDQGISRTVAHYLGMNGHSDANALATVAIYYWQWKHNKRLGSAGREKPTKTEALLVLDHYTDIPDSLVFCSKKGVGAIAPRTMFGFCHYVIRKHGAGREAADSFMNRLISGANLKEKDPLLYCRNRLIEERGKANPNDRAELILRSYNADRLGQNISRITLLGKDLPKLEK